MKAPHDGKRFRNVKAKPVGGFWNGVKVLFAFAKSESWKKPLPRSLPGVLPEQPTDDRVVVTFVNHVTFVIQSREAVILTDPVWSNRVSPFKFVGPSRYREPGIEFSSLRKVDVVAISHNHYDHMDLDTIRDLEKRFSPLFLVALGDKRHLESVGVKRVIEFDWWDEAAMDGGVRATFLPSQHFSSRGLTDRDVSLWGGFMLETSGKKIYFGGDTGYSHHFSEIEAKLGPPDLALIPIGAYEPYWFMGPIHMNPDDAVKAHLDLKSPRSLGMHFGTFRLTTEGIDQPKIDLAKSLAVRNVDPATFVTIPEGESITL